MKRTISILLTLCLMAGLFAAGTLQAAAASDNIAKKIDKKLRPAVYRALGKDGGSITAEECESIVYLQCDNMSISNMKGLEYFPSLQTLYCSRNKIKKLDLSNNQNLEALLCDNNQLSSLNLSNNTSLKGLNCANKNLRKLDISRMEFLVNLDVTGNQLTKLDV